MSDKFGFFDPYFRSNGPFSFFGRDMSLDPKPDPSSLLVPIADRSVGNPPAADAPQPSDADVNALGRLIFAEGASHYQVPRAMEGIGWAVRNRIGGPGFPNTLEGVIKQPHQFAGYGNDLWNQAEEPSTLSEPNATAYQHAQEVARGVLTGQIPDPTGGAAYFYSSDDPNGPPPAGDKFFGPRIDHGRLVRAGDALGNPRIGYFQFFKDTQSR